MTKWISLGERLLHISPGKMDELIALVTKFIEGQELIAEADRLLVLRGKRPDKRYQA